MYTIGNPLIARTMLEHSVAAGLNVPIRILIYEDAESGTTRLVYDLPMVHSRGSTRKAEELFRRSFTDESYWTVSLLIMRLSRRLYEKLFSNNVRFSELSSSPYGAHGPERRVPSDGHRTGCEPEWLRPIYFQ
jgi:hypothetical protein